MRRRYAVRAVIFQEGEWLCAQCLEYDLVAQAKSLQELLKAFERLIVGHITVRLRHKQHRFVICRPPPRNTGRCFGDPGSRFQRRRSGSARYSRAE
jgi:hypothetical protein